MKIIQREFKRILSFFFALVFVMNNSSIAQRALTLEDALNAAMANSPEIKRLELNTRRIQELLNAQNAALKSQFRLSITPMDYSRDRQFNRMFSEWYSGENKLSAGTFSILQPIKWTDGTLSLINRFSWQESFSEFRDTRDKSYSNNLYLSFEQPIFTYNRTKLALRELELDLENADLNFEIIKLTLEKNVTESFYDVYENRMSIEIEKEEYANQKVSYEIIKNKVDAGLAAMEELYQTELNLATSKSNLENRQVIYENSLDTFKKLIGISLFDEISALADISHVPVDIDLQKAIEHGLDSRMELRQRQIDIENSHFELIQTSAMNEFKGNITLTYGVIGNDQEFKNIYEVPAQNRGVALSLDIPLWDWGEKKSRIAASKAVIQTNELTFEDEKNDIIINIRQVSRNLRNLVNQIEIARQNERNAQLTYDINLERYKNGDLTSMDLSLFQNQLSQKKMGLINALIDYKLELLNMKIQSLWDFERNRSVVPIKFQERSES